MQESPPTYDNTYLYTQILLATVSPQRCGHRDEREAKLGIDTAATQQVCKPRFPAGHIHRVKQDQSVKEGKRGYMRLPGYIVWTLDPREARVAGFGQIILDEQAKPSKKTQ